jgi:hypothetical protein
MFKVNMKKARVTLFYLYPYCPECELSQIHKKKYLIFENRNLLQMFRRFFHLVHPYTTK